MGSSKKVQMIWVVLVASALGTIAFNNCTGATFSSVSLQSANTGGSGDYYTGKPGYFLQHEETNPCSQIDTTGARFPNRQIFAQGGNPFLVRDNCQDIEPLAIPVGEIQIFNGGDRLVYKGQSFAIEPDLSKFDVADLSCPAGLSPSGATPVNLFASPLNWSAPEWTWVRPEINAVLFGSLNALPRFRIEVSSQDPSVLFDWYRLGQVTKALKPVTQYTSQFFLSKGNTQGAKIIYYEGSHGSFEVSVDLTTGATNSTTSGILLTEVNSVPSGVGYLINITFKTSAQVAAGDFGVAPSRLGPDYSVQIGDFVYGTAAKWFEVDSFCN